ncbi:MAG TPA: hypothetical protein VKP78_09290 [bacterium]|nr:hypothetical protein [bacterium]
MRSIKLILLSLLTLILLCNCKDIFDPNETISGKGYVVYQSIEGGFYEIIDDNGDNYLPVNIKEDFPEFMQDSLRVKYAGEKCEEQASIYMSGTLIELREINMIED